MDAGDDDERTLAEQLDDERKQRRFIGLLFLVVLVPLEIWGFVADGGWVAGIAAVAAVICLLWSVASWRRAGRHS